MITGFRLRCYPTTLQQGILRRWIGCQRFIYNSKVGEDRYFRAFARKALALAGQRPPLDQQYAQFHGPDTTWLREVPSPVLRNGAVRFIKAYSRFWQQLGGRPTLQKKTGPQSVWLTRELFAFQPMVDVATGAIAGYRLFVGTKKFPLGEIAVVAQRPFVPPAAISLSVDAGRWHLSFANDDGVPEPDERDTAAWLEQFGESELAARTVGLDRGVAIPLATSSGQAFDFSPAQKARLAKKEQLARRWQRRLARRPKGSANRRKAAQRVAAAKRYGADLRREFAHQTSHALVAAPEHWLLVFEALGVQRMSKKPKPKQDANGRWLRNGARAKAGLNAGILRSAWARTQNFTQYKARRAGKLAIAVPAQHSSQECAHCGHTHPDNRPDQATFVCQVCGHQAHADHNAARVIARRGVRLIRSGDWQAKSKKRVLRMRRKETVGPERSEPAVATPPTPVETRVRRSGGHAAAALRSSKQETPTSTLQR
jgi:putative transposase